MRLYAPTQLFWRDKGHVLLSTIEQIEPGNAQRRSRPRRNVPSGTNLLATPSAWLSELSSAIFWNSMTSPIGSSPVGRKHSPSVRLNSNPDEPEPPFSKRLTSLKLSDDGQVVLLAP